MMSPFLIILLKITLGHFFLSNRILTGFACESCKIEASWLVLRSLEKNSSVGNRAPFGTRGQVDLDLWLIAFVAGPANAAADKVDFVP